MEQKTDDNAALAERRTRLPLVDYIAEAILSSPEKRMLLGDIYRYIDRKYGPELEISSYNHDVINNRSLSDSQLLAVKKGKGGGRPCWNGNVRHILSVRKDIFPLTSERDGTRRGRFHAIDERRYAEYSAAKSALKSASSSPSSSAAGVECGSGDRVRDIADKVTSQVIDGTLPDETEHNNQEGTKNGGITPASYVYGRDIKLLQLPLQMERDCSRSSPAHSFQYSSSELHQRHKQQQLQFQSLEFEREFSDFWQQQTTIQRKLHAATAECDVQRQSPVHLLSRYQQQPYTVQPVDVSSAVRTMRLPDSRQYTAGCVTSDVIANSTVMQQRQFIADRRRRYPPSPQLSESSQQWFVCRQQQQQQRQQQAQVNENCSGLLNDWKYVRYAPPQVIASSTNDKTDCIAGRFYRTQQQLRQASNEAPLLSPSCMMDTAAVTLSRFGHQFSNALSTSLPIGTFNNTHSWPPQLFQTRTVLHPAIDNIGAAAEFSPMSAQTTSSNDLFQHHNRSSSTVTNSYWMKSACENDVTCQTHVSKLPVGLCSLANQSSAAFKNDGHQRSQLSPDFAAVKLLPDSCSALPAADGIRETQMMPISGPVLKTVVSDPDATWREKPRGASLSDMQFLRWRALQPDYRMPGTLSRTTASFVSPSSTSRFQTPPSTADSN